MGTKAKAERVAKSLGFVLWCPDYDRRTGMGLVTIDAAGRGQIQLECRGQVVSGHYHKARDFWLDVIAEMQMLGGPQGTCEDRDCEFHEEVEA